MVGETALASWMPGLTTSTDARSVAVTGGLGSGKGWLPATGLSGMPVAVAVLVTAAVTVDVHENVHGSVRSSTASPLPGASGPRVGAWVGPVSSVSVTDPSGVWATLLTAYA